MAGSVLVQHRLDLRGVSRICVNPGHVAGDLRGWTTSICGDDSAPGSGELTNASASDKSRCTRDQNRWFLLFRTHHGWGYYLAELSGNQTGLSGRVASVSETVNAKNGHCAPGAEASIRIPRPSSVLLNVVEELNACANVSIGPRTQSQIVLWETTPAGRKGQSVKIIKHPPSSTAPKQKQPARHVVRNQTKSTLPGILQPRPAPKNLNTDSLIFHNFQTFLGVFAGDAEQVCKRRFGKNLWKLGRHMR